MLEIPVCNAGAYREYLVCHETLQDRPCLRLPVCGETAVLYSLLSAFLYLLLSLISHPSLPLAPPLSHSRRYFASIALSFSFFETPFINYELRAPENKTLKNSAVKCRDFRVCIYLQCCRLSHRLSRRLSRRDFYSVPRTCRSSREIFDKGRMGMSAFRRLTRFRMLCVVVILPTLNAYYQYIPWHISFNSK